MSAIPRALPADRRGRNAAARKRSAASHPITVRENSPETKFTTGESELVNIVGSEMIIKVCGDSAEWGMNAYNFGAFGRNLFAFSKNTGDGIRPGAPPKQSCPAPLNYRAENAD